MKIRIITLPLELLLYIVELAAASDTSAALNLCLVSRTFKSFVTPILYASISLPTKECIRRFIKGVEAAQSNSVDPTRYTRRLCIHRNAMYHGDWTLSLLNNSPLEHLLLCPRFEELPKQEGAEGIELWPHPWHVMILHIPSSWMTHHIALFAQTTHLYLDDGAYPEMVNLCANLPLTHIGMGVWDADDPEYLLAAIPSYLSMGTIEIVSIHAFVNDYPIHDFYGGIWRRLADNTDERLIVMPGLARDQLIEVFESGKTVWERVEDFRNWRETV